MTPSRELTPEFATRHAILLRPTIVMSSSQEHQPLLSDSAGNLDYGNAEQLAGNGEEQQATQLKERRQLHRGLTARQVKMIAIGGTIGTGLFLGTGRSLAQGGPASILICYALVGFIVYVTLLLLGEMGTQYPVSVSVASDLTAAQLVLQFWTDWHPWVISFVFLLFLLAANAASVRSYGEIATIVVFVIVGALVNIGINRKHSAINFSNWMIPGAPFANGLSGFLSVFVTASFAYGGTESLGITAGETRNPTKNMPRIVRAVFWRILLFYVLSIFIIGLNIPYDYPNLSNRSATTSPFTLVFFEAGSNIASSFMNTVILSSVLSAGNHALFAGTRILYSLSTSSPPLAPTYFAHTTIHGVPRRALFGTASISALCFASSYVGSGVLWGWLQNIVGVSNQIAWLSIGLASWRFRKAWLAQARPLDEMKFRAGWTWPWGPPFVIIIVSALILFQGWSSFYPAFSLVDFVSLYVEAPVMALMTFAWLLRRRLVLPPSSQTVPSGISTEDDVSDALQLNTGESINRRKASFNLSDLPDVATIDLYEDEYVEDAKDTEDDMAHAARHKGRWAVMWKVWDAVA
ncbi:hypothetical protein EW145_g1790 [Phellinidium pouzarii]|uniref:Amino acid permease/ SLC12A domain-containing protein n=1 Tax=Phellinidium pouzarii TaxID=167371 RepID=A0A4S4LDP4_9AGAM|nr:hypothetical protein EW145_g1790 [Phellinidium pouzarii]